MMKNRESFLWFLLTILLFSCSEHRCVTNEIFSKGHIVKIDTANEQKWPTYMFGDVIYASDHYSNYSFYGGKLTDNEWQKADRILTSGHGHNEFGCMILSQGNDGALFIQNRDWGNGRILSLTKIPHADSIAAVKDESKWEKYDLVQMPPIRQFFGGFVVLSDSTILVAGAPMKDISHVFSIINYKNKIVTPLDYWPFESSANLTEKLQLYAERCGLLSNGKDKYLYWNGWGPLAFTFSIDGTHVNIFKELRSHTFTKEAPTERVTCCADSNRIYLLYKDSNSKGEKLDKYKDQFIFGNTVEVYDWDGVMLQIIHLDHYGQSIMISKDSKTLYLLPDYSDDIDEPYIYSYDLSTIK